MTSRCTRIRDIEAFDGAWLSDVDCDEVRLRRAMSAAAARAGGEILVGARCRWGLAAASRQRLSCQAAVARGSSIAVRASDDDRRVAALARTWALDDPTGTAAFRMRVSLTALGRLRAVPERRADLVTESAVMPLARRELAAVRVHCERQCTEGATRAAIRVVAGRLGASDVAGVACIRAGEGWDCSGTVADYQVEPGADELL